MSKEGPGRAEQEQRKIRRILATATRQLAALETALAVAIARPAGEPWRQSKIDVLQAQIIDLKALIALAPTSDG